MIPRIYKNKYYPIDYEINIGAYITEPTGFIFDKKPVVVSIFNKEKRFSVSFESGLKEDGKVLISIAPGELEEGNYKIIFQYGNTRIQDEFTVHASSS